MCEILDLLQKQELSYEVLNEVNQACQNLQDPILRFAYEKIILQLYQQESLCFESFNQILQLCTLMKTELNQNKKLNQKKEYIFVVENEIRAWYGIAYQAHQLKQFEISRHAKAKLSELLERKFINDV